jgi:RNA recognition motif-containing protein
MDVRDLFRENVGNVKHVHFFKGETGNFNGRGLVEFETSPLAEEAIKKMNLFEFKGRKIVVQVLTL